MNWPIPTFERNVFHNFYKDHQEHLAPINFSVTLVYTVITSRFLLQIKIL